MRERVLKIPNSWSNLCREQLYHDRAATGLVQGFRVWGSGFRVQGFGCRV